jgi:CRISPR/Cas system CSM-associated protein Csm3 (group 7 of RAMP superfamily)
MRVTVNIECWLASPFVIGTGALADSPADVPTVKDGWHRPIIPGSAFKGRLRHTCEALVRAITRKDESVCRAPAAESMCPYNPNWLGNYCPICLVFGCSTLRSRFQFSDLRWALLGTASVEDWPSTDLRPGVSIERARRVAEEGRLFLIETFGRTRDISEAEISYQGEIAADFPDANREYYGLVGLVMAGLATLTNLGGSRSRGLGRCRFEATARMTDGSVIPAQELRVGMEQWLGSSST